MNVVFPFSYSFARNMDVHSIVRGFKGGDLLYLHNENILFLKHSTRGLNVYFKCYHVLQRDQPNYIHCPVMCTLIDGVCHRNNAEHSHSTNHRVEYNDLQSLNAMKETCRWLREHCPSSANKIPLHDIFMLEISK